MENPKKTKKSELSAVKDPIVFLVKIPNYMEEAFSKGPPGEEIGKLKIYLDKTKKPVFTFNKENQIENSPNEHEFIQDNLTDANMFVLSEEKIPTPDVRTQPAPATGGALAIKGKVTKRCAMKPVMNENYMKWKRGKFEQENTPDMQIIQIDAVVQNFRPRANNDINNKKSKNDEGKNFRADKEQVTEQLFSIFQKHQYYKLPDLVKLTKQPVGYLKEILKEICDFNLSGLHKGTYELKSQYRYYKNWVSRICTRSFVYVNSS